jgi:hypothetical protein
MKLISRRRFEDRAVGGTISTIVASALRLIDSE